MSETVEGGAALAWRLLATLEGGSLILASSALLAYTARRHLLKRQRTVRRVLITNTTVPLGKEIKKQFESVGCACVSSDAISEAGIENKVDALVVVGAEPHGAGLEGMSDLVSKDIYENMKLLDKLSPYVRRGGYMSWASAGSLTSGATSLTSGAESLTSGAYSGAVNAFDTALRASLQHTATAHNCEAVWVGRQDCIEATAEKLVAALMTHTTDNNSDNGFSVRNAALTISKCVGRWLKIIS